MLNDLKSEVYVIKMKKFSVKWQFSNMLYVVTEWS